MENLKLISVRIEPQTLLKIEELQKRSKYWKRSTVINQLLSVVLNCADIKTLESMMLSYRPEKKGYTIKFDITAACNTKSIL